MKTKLKLIAMMLISISAPVLATQEGQLLKVTPDMVQFAQEVDASNNATPATVDGAVRYIYSDVCALGNIRPEGTEVPHSSHVCHMSAQSIKYDSSHTYLGAGAGIQLTKNSTGPLFIIFSVITEANVVNFNVPNFWILPIKNGPQVTSANISVGQVVSEDYTEANEAFHEIGYVFKIKNIGGKTFKKTVTARSANNPNLLVKKDLVLQYPVGTKMVYLTANSGGVMVQYGMLLFPRMVNYTTTNNKIISCGLVYKSADIASVPLFCEENESLNKWFVVVKTADWN
jgi:hypothetical protein